MGTDLELIFLNFAFDISDIGSEEVFGGLFELECFFCARFDSLRMFLQPAF